MIKVKNLSKSYKDKNIFDKLSFEIKPGEKVMIEGKSGSGKTTLLKIISGIDQKYSGKIIIDGKDISNFSEDEKCKFRREQIGFVFQFFNLYEGLDVKNNIIFLSKLYNTDFSAEERCNELMKRLKIEDMKDKMLDTLSGGELQRVAIARSLFNNPKILLLDEANSHLDKENSDNLYKILNKLHKEYNLTIISVNHSDENIDFFDKIIKL